MGVSNLATLFAPCLLFEKSSSCDDPMKLVSDLTRATTVVNYMIDNCQKLLQDYAEFEGKSSSSGSERKLISRYFILEISESL